MKILFTGASSFTGYWFVRTLADAGHEIVATFRRRLDEYTEAPRRDRVGRVRQFCRPVCECAFGDERFVQLVRDQGPWDVYCHHAADVTDYKSADFDVVGALARNTRALTAVLDSLAATGCLRIVLTGSFFENDEGMGSDGRPAFSPYGLSKGLTAQVFRYYSETRRVGLSKFVIPNPFGPFEEPRFTAYLVREWKRGGTPTVAMPAYVRDNIHVSLLAAAYRRFVESAPECGFRRLNPSGYVETQGAFADRFSSEMSPRLRIACPLSFGVQTQFPEPRVRINVDSLDSAALHWDESRAWDEIASYYEREAL